MSEPEVTASTEEIEGFKNGLRAVWGEGNYAELAHILEPAARELVDACAISAGQEILDVAAGNGNLAIAAAEEGASVVASDLTPAMVELGRARSAEAGVEIDWVEADAEALPFEDSSFDCTASVFGAMFAPRPGVAAAELFRVVRPGGTVGLASWTPAGFSGRLFELTTRFAPRPGFLPRPSDWGDPAIVAERLDGLAGSLTCERRAVHWEFESVEAMGAWFEANVGPQAVARRNMPEAVYEEFNAAAAELATDMNQAHDGTVSIDNEYLLVVARKRG